MLGINSKVSLGLQTAVAAALFFLLRERLSRFCLFMFIALPAARVWLGAAGVIIDHVAAWRRSHKVIIAWNSIHRVNIIRQLSPPKISHGLHPLSLALRMRGPIIDLVIPIKKHL